MRAMPKLERARPVHHQVRRLQVAVNDPQAVGLVESIKGLQHERDGHAERQRALPPDDLGQRQPTHVLHDHEVIVAVPQEAVERGDVRMVEPRQRDGLAAKPLDYLRLPC
jgi:hypothetical protein